MFHFVILVLNKHINLYHTPSTSSDLNNLSDQSIQTLLYESFLPLNSLLFLIEINNLTVDQTKYFIEHTIIPAKNYLLKYEGNLQDALREFRTFGPKIVVKDKGLKMPLEYRNSYLEADTSQIAKTLYNMEKEVLVDKIDLQKYKADSKNLDKKFIKMVLSLRKNIVESDNLVSAIKREKKEFIKNFADKRVFSDEELFDLKMKLSLGGSVFAPNLLLQISNLLLMKDKSDFIEKNVIKIFKPLEELSELIKHMSRVSKKDEILKFLTACLKRDDWVFKDILDEAFKARSTILETYFSNEKEEVLIDKERALDKLQEENIQQMIKDIEDLPENKFDKFLVVNGEIQKRYVNFLVSGQKEEEEKLKKYFME